MMDCYCDYDPPAFYNAFQRTARKPHRCEECHAVIPAGVQYEYVSGKWDYGVSIFKTCQRCLDLRTWMKNNVPCFCWAHGNLHQDVIDTAYEAWYQAGTEAQGLRFGALRRIEMIKRASRLPSNVRGGQE